MAGRIPELEPVEPRLLMTTYYASPSGGGDGLSSGNPFLVSSFWPLAKSGDVLMLLDGTYTGPNGMITPKTSSKGTAAQPITVRALNEGKVLINGQGTLIPIRLYDNDYYIIQGINATNSLRSVVDLQYCDYATVRRVCAWDAAEGNYDVFGIHFGGYNLLEDCAGWGRARKIFSASQNGNNNTFRRCWGRFEASESVGNKMTYSTVYNNYNNLFENCIGTWDTSTGKMPDSYVLKDYDGAEFMRIATEGVRLPNGDALKGNYRPNGTMNGKPRYLDYFAADSYMYLWWSPEKNAWVISQGDASGPQLTNYWTKSTNPSSPVGTYTHGPTTTGSPAVELCTYTGGSMGETMGVFGAEGYWGSGWTEDSGLRMLGCIAYVTANQRATGFPGLYFKTATSTVSLQNCASYVDPANTGTYINQRVKPFYLASNRDDADGQYNLVASNLTSVGAVSYTDSSWSVTGVKAIVDGPMPLVPANGTGANVSKQYVNGTLTSTDLWPWPMDQRIYDGMVAGGYTPFYVTDVINSLGATDSQAPRASLTASTITTAAGTKTFSVTFSDLRGLNTATTQSALLTITGPNGYSQVAQLLNGIASADGTTYTGTYQISTPGGAWDIGDNGTYTVTLAGGIVSDGAGNTMNQQTLGTFSVALSAGNPVISSLLSSASTAVLGSTITLTASGVSDPNGTVAGVSFYRDANGNGALDLGVDTLLREDISANYGWTWSGSTSVFSAGANTFFAVVRDNTGLLSTVATRQVTFTAQQSAPIVSSLTSSASSLQIGASLTLTAGSVTDADGTISSVSFYRDSNGNSAFDAAVDTLLGTDASSSGGWTWTGSTAGWTTGTNRFFAVAKDNTNVTGNAATRTVTMTVPPVAPTVGSLSSSAASLQVGSTLALTAGSVSDSDGTISSVSFYRDANGNGTFDATIDALLGTDSSSSGGWTWSGGTAGWSAGTFTFFAVAKDSTNLTSAPKSRQVTLTSAPVVPVAPVIGSLTSSNSNCVSGTSITLSASGVSDADGTVASVNFYRDVNGNGVLDLATDTLLGTDTSSASGWAMALNTSSLGVGTHRLLARVTDNSGLASNIANCVVTVTAPAPAAPTLTSLQSSVGGVTAGGALTLTALGASDSDANVAAVDFYRDLNGNGQADAGIDQLLGTDTSSAGGWAWTGNTAGWNIGTHRLLGVVRDSQGLKSIPAAALVNVLSATAPQTQLAPEVRSLWSSSSTIRLNKSLTLRAAGVSDSDGAVTRVDFYRDSNNNGRYDAGVDQTMGSDTNGADGWAWTGRVDGLSEGTHRFLAIARDNSGLSSSAAMATMLVSQREQAATTTRQWIGSGEATLLQLINVLLYNDTNNNGRLDSGTDLLMATVDQQTQTWNWANGANIAAANRLFAVGQQVGGAMTDVLATIELVGAA